MEQEVAGQAPQRAELDKFQEANKQNLAEIEGLSSQLDEIKKKYAALLAQSENITATIKERDELKKAVYSKDQKLQELLKSNNSLRNYKMIYWFATGGGIFLLGWLIGKFSQRSNKRSLTL
jgi:predicted RNase H-like nuclease (RuvC/YqgF family)